MQTLGFKLADVRRGSANFRDFWDGMRYKSCLCNRELRKRDVVQTYPLEAS
jgi:hypothetical protein